MRTKHKIRTSLLLCSQLLQCPDFQEKGSQQEGSPQRGRDSTVRGLAFEPQNAVLNFGIRVCEGAGSDSEDGFDPEEEVPSTG